jgi:hypothetical protein
VAVRKTRLYDSFQAVHAHPSIRISMLVPIDIPVNCFGVDSIVTFKAPTLAKDNPVEMIARFTDNMEEVE